LQIVGSLRCLWCIVHSPTQRLSDFCRLQQASSSSQSSECMPVGSRRPDILVGVILFFGGLCQFLAGIMEFIAGNSFGATVFPVYAAFNFSYAVIYLPGTGIISAYTDENGLRASEFNNAIGMYCWAWFILAAIFTITATRSSWPLFLTLFLLVKVSTAVGAVLGLADVAMYS
jgi:succinate-acetate transporter protein